MPPILPKAYRRRFAKGSVIFREREPSEGAYLIERGLVELSTSVGGRPQVLAVLGPGEMFGELGALDGSTRSATASAVRDTELTLITNGQLRSRVKAAEPVIQLLLQVIVNRFRHEQNLFRRPETSRRDVTLHPGSEVEDSGGALSKMRLESELWDALFRRELDLHYQPIVRLGTESLVGYEALLRWNHPEWGVVPPDKFIGVAEETALIAPMGRWVLEKACLDLRQLQAQSGAHLTMSVNVSARQFLAPSFLTELTETVQRTGVDPRCLKLELTEGVLMDGGPTASGWLDRCKELGAGIALDDFGTGFSSLSYLASLPIDTLKIDRSFVSGLGKNERSLKVVRAINQLAHTIGLDVVAEGVEEYGQKFQLQQMLCDYAQGYLFSKPLVFDHAMEYAESRTPLCGPPELGCTSRSVAGENGDRHSF